jgi:protein required for attachment to host cells
MPTKVKRIWFVVADSARAQILALNPNGKGLVDVDGVDFAAPEVHIPARDLKSDRPGRSFGSSRSGTRHAIEPHHDYHKLEKHKFIVHLAEALEKAHTARKFDSLVLVAPRRSLGELRISLCDPVRASVEHELAKDLTKHSADSLWLQLAPIADRLLRTVV